MINYNAMSGDYIRDKLQSFKGNKKEIRCFIERMKLSAKISNIRNDRACSLENKRDQLRRKLERI